MSSLFGQLRAMRRLSQLSPEARRFLARAWVTVPVIELSLAVAGVQGTLRWIETIPAAATSARATSIEEGGWLVRAACRRHPLAGQCLSQALLQYLLHRRDGVPARLVIGVKREASRLDAHAWVESPERTAATSGSEFAPLLTRQAPEAHA
ncbi:MAG: lasso peptide biosynthesis B2 protein [Polyangiaceae bacterium]